MKRRAGLVLGLGISLLLAWWPVGVAAQTRVAWVDVAPGALEIAWGEGSRWLQTTAHLADDSVPVGVVYEWGMSSVNGVGELRAEGPVAEFVPLRPGRGDIWVIARWQGGEAFKSIPVQVGSRGDLNADGVVDWLDIAMIESEWAAGRGVIGDYNAVVRGILSLD